ncbi:Hypotetical protein [Gulosibacter molinativorax]|nr:Hypotetical protein [Gulosibacter molinativorax]
MTSTQLSKPAALAAGRKPNGSRRKSTGDWRDAFSKRNISATIFGGYIPILIALVIIVTPLLCRALSKSWMRRARGVAAFNR